jgi:hypothetical protein
MADCIRDRVPPKDMILNAADVLSLRDSDTEDFKYLEGEDLELAKKIATQYNKADKNIKLWKEKKTEADDAMSVLMKDVDLLKDDEGNDIAKWSKPKKGYEKVKSVTVIKKLDGKFYRYLAKNDLLTKTADGKPSVNIKWKE